MRSLAELETRDCIFLEGISDSGARRGCQAIRIDLCSGGKILSAREASGMSQEDAAEAGIILFF
jgi:hypothetical protein